MSSSRDLVVVSTNGSTCRHCGGQKVKVKKHRRDGKGWHHWERCEECIKRCESAKDSFFTPGSKKPQVGGPWKRTVDGEELNAITEKYGGVDGYNKARRKLLKESPLLASIEFRPCPKCGKALSLYQEVRHDRGGSVRSRWCCPACKTEQCSKLSIKRRGGLTERGKLMEAQKGWDKQRRNRAKEARAREKTYLEDKGWTRDVMKKRGITREEYLALLEQQDWKCAIQGCSVKHRPEEFYEKTKDFYLSGGKLIGRAKELATLRAKHLLFVDHDHGTGRVRALLCAECNLVLGHFEKLQKRKINAIAFDAFLYTHGGGTV